MSSNAPVERTRAAGIACAALLPLAAAGALGAPGVVVVACGALAAILAVISPLSVAAAAVVALPYFYHPLGIGSQRVAASELLIAAALLGTGAREARMLISQPRAFRVRWGVLLRDRAGMRLLALVVGLVALGALYVARPYDPTHRAESLREWRWTLAEPAALVAIVIVCARRAWQRSMMALSLLVGAAVAALHGMTDLWQGGGVVVEGVRRVSGPYPHPNALALFLGRSLAFGVAWWVLDRQRRALLTVPLFACGVALLASFSRGALVAVGIAMLLLAWRLAPRMRLAAVGSLVLGGLTVLVLARERMTDLFSGGSGTLRIEIWTSTLAMIRDRPMLGYGPDQFLYAYLPRYVTPSNWDERFTSHPHNFVLDFWVRLGIIGATFAVFVACLMIVRAIPAVRRTAPAEPIATAAAIGSITLLVHGLVDNSYFTHDLAMSAWLLAWLAFTSPDVERAEGTDELASAGRRRGRIHRFSFVRQPDRPGA